MGSSSKRSWKLQEYSALSSNVNCVALGHQTGQVMVTGSRDGKVNLWAVEKHNYIMSLCGHATEIRSVQFGNTDEVVCAGSSAGIIKIWDLNAAKLVRNLSGHRAAAVCTDFHPYGNFLASGSTDRTIKLWDFRKKGCICTYEGHTMAVNSLRFSPDGHWIASAGEDGLVRVTDIRGGRLLKQFTEHIFPVTSIQFHPHEFLLCSGGTDGVINFYDLENFTLVSQTEQNVGNISTMTFSRKGECLYVATDEHLKVYAWEPARLLYVENIKWGQVKDLVLTENQLIGASHMLMNVSVHLLDLRKLPPARGMDGSLNTQSDSIRNSSPVKSPFSYGQSVRKSFSKERPKSSRPVEVIKTIDESEKSSTDAEEEMGSDLPSTADYMDIFQPARALNRTPPPDLSQIESEMRDLSEKQYLSDPQNLSNVVLNYDHRSTNRPDHMPIPITSSESESTSPSAVSAPSSPKFKPSLHRQLSCKDSSKNPKDSPLHNPNENVFHIPHSASDFVLHTNLTKNGSKSTHNLTYSKNYLKDNANTKYQSTSSIGSGDNYVSNKNNNSKNNHVVNKNITRRKTTQVSVVKLNKSSNVMPEHSDLCAEQLIPNTIDRPIGLDVDEFLPKSHMSLFENMSEQEVLSTMMGGHDKLMTVLSGRQRNYQTIYTQYKERDLKAALEYLGNLQDNLALLADLLRTFVTKPSMWDLDMCVVLLPQIHELLQSKYESYVQTGCETLRLILQNFSSVIRSNVIAPVGSYGVDIPREERYAKCVKCHENLLQIRTFLLKRQTLQGKLGTIFRELQTMMQGIDS